MRVTKEQMAASGKILREMRGIRTKAGVARQIGLPYSTYCSYESGARCPGGRMKKKLADYFGVEVSDIFFLPDDTAKTSKMSK